MGKIRVKTLGEEIEEKPKKKSYEEKKAEKAKKDTGKEIATDSEPKTSFQEVKEEKKETKTPIRSHKKSKRHTSNLSTIDKNKQYKLDESISSLKKLKTSKFDETVELHLNVKEQGIHGQIELPYGTGKKLRIKIADDALIQEVEKGKIDFDVLLASPSIMPKLAKVARILGPRGLMPNPKNGTITDNPEAVIEKLSRGQVNYKTEAKAPIIHLSVGKLSFEDEKLKENVSVTIKTIGTSNISKAVIKSTMSPGLKLDLSSV